MHGLAGPVDAAVEPDIAVGTVRPLPAADIVAAEVDGIALQIEQGEIIVTAIGGHQPRRHRPVAPCQRCVESRPPIPVRRRGGEDLVGARDELQFHPRLRPGRLQRTHDQIDPVGTAIGRDREVRDYQPAFRPRRHLVVGALGRVLHGDIVGAGRKRADRTRDREDGGHRRVGRAARRHLPVPDPFADLVRAFLLGHPVVLALAHGESAGDRAEGQGPVGNPPDLELDRLDIDRLDGQPVSVAPRQDDAIAGETDKGGPVAEIQLDLFVDQQLALACRRQTGAKRQALPGRRTRVRRHTGRGPTPRGRPAAAASPRHRARNRFAGRAGG